MPRGNGMDVSMGRHRCMLWCYNLHFELLGGSGQSAGRQGNYKSSALIYF